MEPKFTNGPWESLPDYHQGPIVVDAGQNIIVDYTCWSGDDLTEAKANAHLIAAAPDMYAELDNFVQSVECAAGCDDEMTVDDRDAEVLKSFGTAVSCSYRAAITTLSRARGETK